MTNRSLAERAHEALHKSGWQNAITRFFGQRGK
jgi:hypothetical protein